MEILNASVLGNLCFHFFFLKQLFSFFMFIETYLFIKLNEIYAE